MTYVSKGQKELKTKYPYTAGTTAKTTKQVGKKYLHAQTGSNVLRKEKIGLGD